MRVISISLILNALCIVQRTKLIKCIDFKTQTKISLTSIVVSGGIGILLAFKGFGVWALCLQTILNSLFQLLLLSVYVHWKPLLLFSRQSFHEMFNFGSKILGASIISVIYSNLYTIVIGKRFASETLGYYSRADQFDKFPSNNIAAIISGVSLPVLSKIQDDKDKLLFAYRKVIKYSSFIIFPLMLGLFAISKPFVMVALTEKWIGVVPIMQILCLGYMIDHLSVLNLNLLYVEGRTDLVLKLEIIKKTIAISILLVTLPFGIIIMCWGKITYDFIAVLINSYYTNKLIKLSMFQQLLDILPYLLASVVMAIVVLLFNCFIGNYLMKLLFGMIIGGVVYSFSSILFFRSELKEVLSVIKKMK
jgi:O-antigen/teichoic acid export membrane protein